MLPMDENNGQFLLRNVFRGNLNEATSAYEIVQISMENFPLEEIVLIAYRGTRKQLKKTWTSITKTFQKISFLFCLYNYRKGVNSNSRGNFAILQFHDCYIRLNNSIQIKNAVFYRCFRSQRSFFKNLQIKKRRRHMVEIYLICRNAIPFVG